MADCEALEQALAIEEVVGEYVQLRKAGNPPTRGWCPFHGEYVLLHRQPGTRGFMLRLRKGR